MISARRAALLGLTTPLTAIMVAVLGLWPELDDELPAAPSFVQPGGRGLRKIAWDDVVDDDSDEDEAALIMAHNQAILSLVATMTMAMTEGML